MNHDWHTEKPRGVAEHFGVVLSQGLSDSEAQIRLKKCGANAFTKQKTISPITIFFQQFGSVVIWVLLTAVLVSFLLGEQVDAIAILTIVILNAAIGFFIEYRADRAMLALAQMATPTATVLRDGHAKNIAISDVVPGDILCLKGGDLISADALLFETASFKVNEASLTGESVPIEKIILPCSENTALADRKNRVYRGTDVANGTAKAIVVETGMQTEMGKIAQMLGEATQTETPLQKKLNQVGTRLLWICLFIMILIFVLGLFRSIPLFKLFMSSVSLAVAAIPEGLPAVVTIALALGVQRMVRRAVLVRRLSSVETLGCLQVICTDKTGTLTVGEMTARKLIIDGEIYSIHGEGYHLAGNFFHQNHVVQPSEDKILKTVLRAAVACNNASIALQGDQLSVMGDPTEIALLIAGAKDNIYRDELASTLPRIKEFPFNSDRKRMSVICGQADQIYTFTKGAPEIILERCTHILTIKGLKEITQDDRVRIQQSCQLMTSEALRVLALAERQLKTFSNDSLEEEIENNLVFLGLIGLQDPPHADAKESVDRCKKAGIKPVMITGDHPDTARAIAVELGILNSNDIVMTGAELDKMSEEEFFNNVKQIAVYARVTAMHKLKIVRAWKKHNRVVGMTGDGVNDAPALKESSVGIAMGKTGTAVTKEAADMIVMDNNFSSIVSGIEEGRTIYDNILKTLAYLLSGNAAELFVVFFALLIGWPLPLLPIQLLWINLVTDGLPAIALATDPSEPGLLQRQPRSPQQSMMDKIFMQRVLFIGFLTAFVTLCVFGYELIINKSLTQAQDAAFSVLVTAEILRALGARSHTQTIFQLGIFSNIRLFIVISASFILQIMIHHVPILQTIFKIDDVSLLECLSWILIGAIPFIVIEFHKFSRKTLHAEF